MLAPHSAARGAGGPRPPSGDTGRLPGTKIRSALHVGTNCTLFQKRMVKLKSKIDALPDRQTR